MLGISEVSKDKVNHSNSPIRGNLPSHSYLSPFQPSFFGTRVTMGNSTPPRHLLLFGDYSIEKLASVKALVQHAKTLPAAERFLREATEVIQAEFSRTDKAVHGWEGTTASLLEMAEAVDSPGGGNLAVATVLLCAGRLGQLIVYVEDFLSCWLLMLSCANLNMRRKDTRIRTLRFLDLRTSPSTLLGSVVAYFLRQRLWRRRIQASSLPWLARWCRSAFDWPVKLPSESG